MKVRRKLSWVAFLSIVLFFIPKYLVINAISTTGENENIWTNNSLEDESLIRTDDDLKTTTLMPKSLKNKSENCDIKNTSCTSTLVPTSSTPKSLTSTISTKPRKPSDKIKYKIDRNKQPACSCNLNKNHCDINCCCDKQCNVSGKFMFSKCKSMESQTDNYFPFCGTKSSWEKYWIFNNDLLCIKNYSVVDKYFYLEKKKKEQNELKLLKSFYNSEQKFKWPIFNEEMIGNVENLTDFSKYENTIWILKNKEIIPFEIPEDFSTNICLAKKKITFLKDATTKCYPPSFVGTKNLNLNLETFYENITFVSSIRSFMKFWDKKKEQVMKNCSKNVCISPEVTLCDENFKSCSNSGMKSTNKKMTCTFIKKENFIVCKNIVKKVRYEFFYKGIEGITRISIKINLQNFSYYLNVKSLIFFQEFEVKFQWHDYKIDYTEQLSGDPGYLVGKPILITRLNGTFNSSKISSVNFTTSSLHNDTFYPDNFLVFPYFNNKRCVVSNDQNTPVEFGHNSIYKCRIEEEIILKKNETKKSVASHLCQKVQEIIFKYWSLYKNNTVVFGKFGNSDRYESNDWLGPIYLKNYTVIINETFGNFSIGNKSLICSKLYSKISIEFYYRSVDLFVKSINQNKIIAIIYNFSQLRDDFVFSNTFNNNKMKFFMPLVSEVVFHHITDDVDEEINKNAQFGVNNSPFDSSYYQNIGNKLGLKIRLIFLLISIFLQCLCNLI